MTQPDATPPRLTGTVLGMVRHLREKNAAQPGLAFESPFADEALAIIEDALAARVSETAAP